MSALNSTCLRKIGTKMDHHLSAVGNDKFGYHLTYAGEALVYTHQDGTGELVMWPLQNVHYLASSMNEFPLTLKDGNVYLPDGKIYGRMIDTQCVPAEQVPEPVQVEDTTVYQLGPKGSNYFSFAVQGGGPDAASREECKEIAKVFAKLWNTYWCGNKT